MTYRAYQSVAWSELTQDNSKNSGVCDIQDNKNINRNRSKVICLVFEILLIIQYSQARTQESCHRIPNAARFDEYNLVKMIPFYKSQLIGESFSSKNINEMTQNMKLLNLSNRKPLSIELKRKIYSADVTSVDKMAERTMPLETKEHLPFPSHIKRPPKLTRFIEVQ
jgi:hypothetical protein